MKDDDISNSPLDNSSSNPIESLADTLTSVQGMRRYSKADEHGRHYVALDANGKFVRFNAASKKPLGTKIPLPELALCIKECVLRTSSLSGEKANRLYVDLHALKGRIQISTKKKSLIYRLFNYFVIKAALANIDKAIAHTKLLTASDASTLVPASKSISTFSSKTMTNASPTPSLTAEESLKFAFGFGVSKEVEVSSLCKSTGVSVDDANQLLEGGNPQRNMEYLLKKVEEDIASPEVKHSDPEYLLKLQSFRNDLKRSLEVADELNKFISSLKSQSKADPKKIKGPLGDAVDTLPIGGRLIIPVGTMNHSVYLVLHKTESDIVQPILYNTGEGIEHHMGIFDISHKQVSPALIYPSIEVGYGQGEVKIGKLVTESLTGVLKASAAEQKKTTDDSLQATSQAIDTMYTLLEKQLGTPKKGPKRQLNTDAGVCSFAALNEVYKDLFNNKKQYARFQCGFLKQIKEELKAPYFTGAKQHLKEKAKSLLEPLRAKLQERIQKFEAMLKLSK